MSSTKTPSERQQGQNNQHQVNDPKRMGNNPVEPQKNERDNRNEQSQKGQHDNTRDKQLSR
jgi:hypothetical protein